MIGPGNYGPQLHPHDTQPPRRFGDSSPRALLVASGARPDRGGVELRRLLGELCKCGESNNREYARLEQNRSHLNVLQRPDASSQDGNQVNSLTPFIAQAWTRKYAKMVGSFLESGPGSFLDGAEGLGARRGLHAVSSFR